MPQRQHKLMVLGICAKTAKVVLVWSSTLSTAAIYWKPSVRLPLNGFITGVQRSWETVNTAHMWLDAPDRLIGGRSDSGALSRSSRVQSCQAAVDCGRNITIVMSTGREAGFPPSNCFFFLVASVQTESVITRLCRTLRYYL